MYAVIPIGKYFFELHSQLLSVANDAELDAFKSAHEVPVKHSPCSFNLPTTLHVAQYLFVVSGLLPIGQLVELKHVFVEGSK